MPPPRPPSGAPTRPRNRGSSDGSTTHRGDVPDHPIQKDLSEIARLREENEELRARCNWQAEALRELRQKCEEVQSQTSGASTFPSGGRLTGAVPPSTCSSRRLAPVARCEMSVQTEELTQKEADKYLDAAHKKAGEKTRELYEVQTQKSKLEGQVRMQENLISQYKDEIETLEEQLRLAIAKQHRAEHEKTFVEQSLKNGQKSARGTSLGRPSCVSQAWGEANCQPACEEDSTRASSLSSTLRAPPSASGMFQSSASPMSQRPMSARMTSRTASPTKPWGLCREEAAFEEPSSSDEDSPRASKTLAMKMASLKSQLEHGTRT